MAAGVGRSEEGGGSVSAGDPLIFLGGFLAWFLCVRAHAVALRKILRRGNLTHEQLSAMLKESP